MSTSVVRPAPRVTLKKALLNTLHYGVLIVLALLFLLPFYLIVRNGLATEQEITSPNWTFFPSALHFENIGELFSDSEVPFSDGMVNSALIAFLQTVGQILISLLAGYGLARVPYRYANQVFYTILLTLMIPSAVIYVPTYVVVSYLGWLSTLQGLVVPGIFSGFTTFLFRQFFLSFPRELEEAGRVDGLGYWGTFWRIVVPNSYGIIAALSVITFIQSWNAFLWPFVVGQDRTAWTVQVVLSNFLNAQVLNLHELFIGAAVAILPLMVLFFLLQRYIVEGYKQSGLKG
ncbi:multiple sugar transport system permease protein [Thermosporothrix hazakensis]|jgi:multiple sugar transport system permease protein|uniref:Multiple sugar transport system permease protein n=1 Tax=Thermosporothrix hazakensis TaxID=644383 RepID=A0A326UCY1_THEHA|nr:carbohydrate ABC transporter permease [Thermosporothrix hazakensis]PZW34355.1 multiple sugar transport system permease protein [Thermosporothrix hazakensis]GCE46096.1 sugar ABC transporter permease [Thermosporothrix hazakensis]